jgi:hypothetical protein
MDRKESPDKKLPTEPQSEFAEKASNFFTSLNISIT